MSVPASRGLLPTGLSVSVDVLGIQQIVAFQPSSCTIPVQTTPEHLLGSTAHEFVQQSFVSH